MKIMMFNTFYHPNIFGGAEKSVQLLAEGLSELGHQIIAVSLSEHQDQSYSNNVKVHYIFHHNLYWGGLSTRNKPWAKFYWHLKDIFNPAIYKEVVKLIQLEKPDLIHTHLLTGFSAAPWIAAKRHHIPVVHTLRDYSLICEKSTMFKNDKNCVAQCLACRQFSVLKKHLSNHGFVYHLSGVSNFIIDRHLHQGYFNNVPHTRIFSGVQTDAGIPLSTQPGKTITLLYLGRIDRTKGVAEILEVVNDMDGVELWLGGTVFDAGIQAKIGRGYYASNIRFLGFIDPETVFNAVDVVIIPSLWHEPLARVAIEAYQHGKPVIASNRGGLPELVHESQTGFLYDPDKPGELTGILEKIKNNPGLITVMHENIKQYVSQFNNLNISRQYEQLYKKVLCSIQL